MSSAKREKGEGHCVLNNKKGSPGRTRSSAPSRRRGLQQLPAAHADAIAHRERVPAGHLAVPAEASVYDGVTIALPWPTLGRTAPTTVPQSPLCLHQATPLELVVVGHARSLR
jgi:hypothetical protein